MPWKPMGTRQRESIRHCEDGAEKTSFAESASPRRTWQSSAFHPPPEPEGPAGRG